MFESVLMFTPRPFRSKARKRLSETLLQNATDHLIDESLLKDCVRSSTPGPFVSKVMKRLEELS